MLYDLDPNFDWRQIVPEEKMNVTWKYSVMEMWGYDLLITDKQVFMIPDEITRKDHIKPFYKFFNIADIAGYKKGFALNFYILFRDGSQLNVPMWKKSKLMAILDARRPH